MVRNVAVLMVISAVAGFALAPVGAHDGPHSGGEDESHEHLVATAFHSEIRISEDGRFREIRCNGIPDHEPGQFPNRHNPNAIRPQQYRYRVTLNPQPAERVTPLRHQLFGVALNGVPFDPATAEFWQGNRNSGWNYEAIGSGLDLGLDRSLAHVQPSGAYHYHGIPYGYIQLLQKKQRVAGMVLVGYAADGFPIYSSSAHDVADDAGSRLRPMKPSYRLQSGVRPSGPGGKFDGTFTADWAFVAGTGDLDECNGRRGVTPEYPDGTYYYVLTETFPFIPRAFRGTPDDSFAKRGPGGGPPGGGPPGRRPFPPGGGPNF